MSTWGELEASFLPLEGWKLTPEDVGRGMPTGSETGPSAGVINDQIYVYGRLRDVEDTVDSPGVLAWFVRIANQCQVAQLRWSIDRGPAYTYAWADGSLRRVRGVLDL